jgi:hypothetical protein
VTHGPWCAELLREATDALYLLNEIRERAFNAGVISDLPPDAARPRTALIAAIAKAKGEKE